MTPNCRRGSEWRKWDLHLHAPRTKQNDQFRVPDGTEIWDEYFRRLHETDVQAFGITDYFSADCYFSAVAEYRTRHSELSKIFFPNIELRTIYVVNKAETEPKPVLSGCDAHSLRDLDAKLGQVVSSPTDGIVLDLTWIKADLTYEGLKQIIFEPDNRVFIGAEPEAERRVRQNGTRYIKSLCIAGYQKDQHGKANLDDLIKY